MYLLEPYLPKPQYTAGDNIGIISSTCRPYTLINSIMCSNSYPIPILSLFFLYHPYIPSFLIRRKFYFLVIILAFKEGLSRILCIFQICYICVALDAYYLEKNIQKFSLALVFTVIHVKIIAIIKFHLCC